MSRSLFIFRHHKIKWNNICKKKYLSCVPGVVGKILPRASCSPRYGFSHPHQKHMKNTYILYARIPDIFLTCPKNVIASAYNTTYTVVCQHIWTVHDVCLTHPLRISASCDVFKKRWVPWHYVVGGGGFLQRLWRNYILFNIKHMFKPYQHVLGLRVNLTCVCVMPAS